MSDEKLSKEEIESIVNKVADKVESVIRNQQSGGPPVVGHYCEANEFKCVGTKYECTAPHGCEHKFTNV